MMDKENLGLELVDRAVESFKKNGGYILVIAYRNDGSGQLDTLAFPLNIKFHALITILEAEKTNQVLQYLNGSKVGLK